MSKNINIFDGMSRRMLKVWAEIITDSTFPKEQDDKYKSSRETCDRCGGMMCKTLDGSYQCVACGYKVY